MGFPKSLLSYFPASCTGVPADWSELWPNSSCAVSSREAWSALMDSAGSDRPQAQSHRHGVSILANKRLSDLSKQPSGTGKMWGLGSNNEVIRDVLKKGIFVQKLKRLFEPQEEGRQVEGVSGDPLHACRLLHQKENCPTTSTGPRWPTCAERCWRIEAAGVPNREGAREVPFVTVHHDLIRPDLRGPSHPYVLILDWRRSSEPFSILSSILALIWSVTLSSWLARSVPASTKLPSVSLMPTSWRPSGGHLRTAALSKLSIASVTLLRVVFTVEVLSYGYKRVCHHHSSQDKHPSTSFRNQADLACSDQDD